MKHQPPNGGNRIIGYDIARGIAIFLMLIINIKAILPSHGADPKLISNVFDFLDRRAAAALVMVSGIGLTLFTKNPGTMEDTELRSGSRRTLIDRALFLLISGYVFSIIWDADILHFYGVFILIGVFLAARSNRVLIAAAALFWMVSFIQFFEIYDYLQEDLYFSSLYTPLIHLFFTDYYPVFPWAAFFISGMFLGRLDLQNNGLKKRILITGLLLFIGSELISRFFTGLSDLIHSCSSALLQNNLSFVHTIGWLVEIDLKRPTPFSAISAAGSGIIIITAGISLAAARQTNWINYLIIGGRNTLTLYITHIIFLILVCEMFKGSSLKEGVIPTPFIAVFVFFIYVKCSSWWLERYGNGPFETLMRRFAFFRRLNRRNGKAVQNSM